MISACNKCGEQYPSAPAGHIHKCGKCSGGICSPLPVDTEALIAAVRAGDIEAAQALLPVDPIVKRAREICARHMGTPATYIAGKMDGWPAMGAVSEALRTTHSTVTAVSGDQILRMARAAVYAASPNDPGRVQYLNGDFDNRQRLIDVRKAIEAALA